MGYKVNGRPLFVEIKKYQGNTDYSPDTNYFNWSQEQYLDYVKKSCYNKPYIF